MKNDEKKFVSKFMEEELSLKQVLELNRKYELDDVDDLWYFVRSNTNRWIAGSAH